MNPPEPFTIDLDAETLLQARVLLEQGRVSEMYGLLREKGSLYAVLAQGVIHDDTLSGKVALGYIEEVAQRHGQPLGQPDIDAMQHDLASGYLEDLATASGSSGRQVDEFSAEQAWALHERVFSQHGLGPEAWTLHLPFSVFGDKKQSYWEYLLSSVGKPASELALAVDLLGRMSVYGWLFGDETEDMVEEWKSTLYASVDADTLGELGSSALEAIQLQALPSSSGNPHRQPCRPQLRRPPTSSRRSRCR